MKRFVLIFALCLAGCSAAAKDAVRGVLLDPDAAQFKNMETCPAAGGMATGEVNAKNRSGAFAGSMPFFVNGPEVTFVDDPSFTRLLDECYGNVAPKADLDIAIRKTSKAASWAEWIDPGHAHSASGEIRR